MKDIEDNNDENRDLKDKELEDELNNLIGQDDGLDFRRIAKVIAKMQNRNTSKLKRIGRWLINLLLNLVFGFVIGVAVMGFLSSGITIGKWYYVLAIIALFSAFNVITNILSPLLIYFFMNIKFLLFISLFRLIVLMVGIAIYYFIPQHILVFSKFSWAIVYSVLFFILYEFVNFYKLKFSYRR